MMDDVIPTILAELCRFVVKTVRFFVWIALIGILAGFSYFVLTGQTDFTAPSDKQLDHVQFEVRHSPFFACELADRIAREGRVTALQFGNFYLAEWGDAGKPNAYTAGYNGWLKIKCSKTQEVIRFIEKLKQTGAAEWDALLAGRTRRANMASEANSQRDRE